MNNIKLLIFGGNGWIGQKFLNVFNSQHINYKVSLTRANNYEDVITDVENYKPTHILCCIGRTHGPENSTIDYLELPGKLTENIRDNMVAPITLANICSARNIHLTYIGTGCIFDYTLQEHFRETGKASDTQYYKETDMPDFFGSAYSTVKGYTDTLMKSYTNVLNCRIRMPIDSTNNKRNFIAKIINYDKICSMDNSMTVLDQIIPIIVHMIMTKTTGTFNMTNPGFTNHNDILTKYKNTINPQFKIVNFTLDEQHNILLSRRSNNVLNTDKLEGYCKVHSLTLDNIANAIDIILDRFD